LGVIFDGIPNFPEAPGQKRWKEITMSINDGFNRGLEQMLTYSPLHPDPPPFRDRIQIALAIAEPTILQSILTECLPPIAAPHRIGNISSTIGVPIEAKTSVAGTIQIEEIACVLIESPQEAEQAIAAYTQSNPRGCVTRCEAETRDLGLITNLAQAIARLTQAGLPTPQIQTLLHLPQEAWHKTWWYMPDEFGDFTIPFLRLMRAQYYLDGRISIQYKDLFADEKPPCFKSQERKILVEIYSETKGFRKTLEKINYARQQTGIERALLIGDRFSELEAQGFMSQGISLYAAQEIILPVQANCAFCATDCPMQGREDSPVLTCEQFCLDGV
jgi:hypothetical protein